MLTARKALPIKSDLAYQTIGIKKMESKGNGRKVIVIGGGCGGLFTAALLAKKSYQVTVIEKNAAVGGGLSTFRRGGMAFQPGMHIIGGLPITSSQRELPDALSYGKMHSDTSVQFNTRETSQNNFVNEQGNTLERVFRELGIKAEVRNCPRRMVVLSDSSVREIPATEGAVVDMLCKEFPAEKEGIAAYYRRIREIYDAVPLLNPTDMSDGAHSPMLNPTDKSDVAHSPMLNPTDKSGESHSDELLSTESFIEKYVSDEKLKAILGSLNLLTGTESGITPAYAHAIINELYTRQFAYFPDGTEEIVRQLIGIIEDAGGKVLNKTAVTAIHFGMTDTGERCVNAVETSDGVLHTADTYISSISPALLPEISGEKGAFSKIQRKRIESLRDGFSMFTVYAKVKADSLVPEGATFCFPDYDSVWRQGSIYNGDWLHGALFVRFGEQLTAMAAMPFSEVERWENRRDSEYRIWKEEQTKRVLSLIDKSILYLNRNAVCRDTSSNEVSNTQVTENSSSQTEGCDKRDTERRGLGVEVLCSASPLSIRDWLGTRHGAAYGFSIDCHNPLLSRFSPETKAVNLFLTGQALFLHGLCGTVMSAVTTVRNIGRI